MPTLTDTITTLVNSAAAAALTAKDAAHTAMDNAVAASPAGPGCLSGITQMEDAWGQVALAFKNAGKIESLQGLIATAALTGTVLPGVGSPVTGPLDVTAATANAATQLAAANANADDARSYVLTHSPDVLAKYSNCICSSLSLAGILDAQACINANLPLLDSAVLQVANPDNTAVHGAVDDIVTSLVNRAATLPLSGDCNAGVTELKKALDLINHASSVVNAIKACIDKLTALAPADPLLATALPKFNSAKTALDNATNILNNDTAVITAWQNRARCILRHKTITIVVRDESGDQMGAGVSLSVSNPIIDALHLPGIDATGVIGSTVCPGSQASITVPLAGIHLDPPAGAPPQPPSVPIIPETGLLIFNVTSQGDHPAFTAPVNATGMLTTSDPLRITLQLPDTSSITSC